MSKVLVATTGSQFDTDAVHEALGLLGPGHEFLFLVVQQNEVPAILASDGLGGAPVIPMPPEAWAEQGPTRRPARSSRTSVGSTRDRRSESRGAIRVNGSARSRRKSTPIWSWWAPTTWERCAGCWAGRCRTTSPTTRPARCSWSAITPRSFLRPRTPRGHPVSSIVQLASPTAPFDRSSARPTSPPGRIPADPAGGATYRRAGDGRPARGHPRRPSEPWPSERCHH
jgi:hypothetical protein